jgi:hypothetical protein
MKKKVTALNPDEPNYVCKTAASYMQKNSMSVPVNNYID